MRTKLKKKSIYWAFSIIAVVLFLGVLYSLVRHLQAEVRHPREGGDSGSQESQNNTSIESKEEKSLDSSSTCFDSSKQKYPCGVRGNDVAGVLPKNTVQATSSASQTLSPKATLTIWNESLEFPLTEEMTVYDAMNLLKEEGKLTFEGKNYPALGFFVTSINSISTGGGKNLFYYINGEEASVGISTYQIKEGDSIEWKLK